MCVTAVSVVLFDHPSRVLEKAVLPLDVAPPVKRGPGTYCVYSFFDPCGISSTLAIS